MCQVLKTYTIQLWSTLFNSFCSVTTQGLNSTQQYKSHVSRTLKYKHWHICHHCPYRHGLQNLTMTINRRRRRLVLHSLLSLTMAWPMQSRVHYQCLQPMLVPSLAASWLLLPSSLVSCRLGSTSTWHHWNILHHPPCHFWSLFHIHLLCVMKWSIAAYIVEFHGGPICVSISL